MTETQYPSGVIEAAHSFRTIMDAVARPGRILPFTAVPPAPWPLWTTTASVARTLCDFQTPVWLSPELCTEPVTHYIRFHTGAPIVSDAGGCVLHLPAGR